MPHNPPAARIDGSLHDYRAPGHAVPPGYISLTGLRFEGGPYRVTDCVRQVGTAYIQLAPGISIAIRSAEQARALIAAAGIAAEMFATATAEACGLCASTGHVMDTVTNSRAPGGSSLECHDLTDCRGRAKETAK